MLERAITPARMTTDASAGGSSSRRIGSCFVIGWPPYLLGGQNGWTDGDRTSLGDPLPAFTVL